MFFYFTEMGCENHWSRLHPSPSYVDVSAFVSFVAWFQRFFNHKKGTALPRKQTLLAYLVRLQLDMFAQDMLELNGNSTADLVITPLFIHIYKCFVFPEPSTNATNFHICISFYHQPKNSRPLETIGERVRCFTCLRFLAQQAALLYLRLGQDLDSPVHGEGAAVVSSKHKGGNELNQEFFHVFGRWLDRQSQ